MKLISPINKLGLQIVTASRNAQFHCYMYFALLNGCYMVRLNCDHQGANCGTVQFVGTVMICKSLTVHGMNDTTIVSLCYMLSLNSSRSVAPLYLQIFGSAMLIGL